MGYYVTLTNSNFQIAPENLDAAYQAMCALNTTHDHLKHGGSWSGGKQTAKWFSWMDANYPETCEDAAAIFKALGFEVWEQEDGTLELQGYDSKIGNEDIFIEAAGAFANEDWFVVWRGEDGDTWMQDAEGRHAYTNVRADEYQAMVAEVNKLRARLAERE